MYRVMVLLPIRRWSCPLIFRGRVFLQSVKRFEDTRGVGLPAAASLGFISARQSANKSATDASPMRIISPSD